MSKVRQAVSVSGRIEQLARAVLPPNSDVDLVKQTASKIQSSLKYNEVIRIFKLWLEYADYCGDSVNDSIDRSLFRDTVLQATYKLIKSLWIDIGKPLPFAKPIERPVLPPKPELILKLPIAKEKRKKPASKARKTKELSNGKG